MKESEDKKEQLSDEAELVKQVFNAPNEKMEKNFD